MAARTYRPKAPFESTPPARRATGFGLALGLNLLLLFLLIGISAYHPIATKDDGGTLVFDVAQRDQPTDAEPERPEQQQQRNQPVVERPVLPPPKIVLPVPPTIAPPPETETKLDLVELTKEEQSDTDKAMADRSGARSRGSGAGGDTPVVGKGPNGESLYAAEWMREPTDQEIGNYIKANTRPGVGYIACKTYPRFRVDDCVALGSEPASSNVHRVLMEAAWQFKVRPPRKNGQPLIGAWVQIRLDYRAKGE